MKFEFNDFHRDISDEELLQDLRRVHTIIAENGSELTFRSYNEHGRFSSATISTRFSTWNNALIKAGLTVAEEKNITEARLFENLKNV